MKNINVLSRRKFFNYLTLIVTGINFPWYAFGGVRKKVDEIISKTNFENQTTAVLLDLQTNKVLENYNKDLKLPLASVTKMVTAVYGIEAIGEDYSFVTRLFIDGKVRNGVLEGNLYLIGGGDPSLSTDDLHNFVDALKVRGIKEISGYFFYNSEIIPEFLIIDPLQLPQESFNPGFSGLNLNNNKVLFSWTRKGKNYELNLGTRSLKSKVSSSHISIVGKNQGNAVFEYVLERKKRLEKWVVVRKVLGKKGVRWLPVRLASTYTSSVLYQLCVDSNISVCKPTRIRKNTSGSELIYSHKSKDLSHILKKMLDQSTNVTAEIIGVFAANFWGLPTSKIFTSGLMMSKWFNFVSKTDGNTFYNHSGLTSDSRVSSIDFTRFLYRKETKEILIPLLKGRRIYGGEEKKIRQANINIVAKTGTMHFNRSLAGYIIRNGVPRAVFAIFSADLVKKKAVKKHQLANPPGSKYWLRQAKTLENDILTSWAKKYI
ncbi:MAG: D-alanyl-D-alanine carboxypeptidase/D-alanyl-D-alanine-endopeptidase [Paracoccaceae bacterium]|nr:D-alanyl-D-alanine carboxypeptidase/D-alanyl-D-alanine-endopeptidase [Paracoccaceae bacterium]